MSTFSVIALLIIFGALQVLCYLKGKKKIVSYIPVIIGGLGELIGLFPAILISHSSVSGNGIFRIRYDFNN